MWGQKDGVMIFDEVQVECELWKKFGEMIRLIGLDGKSFYISIINFSLVLVKIFFESFVWVQ